MKNKLLLNSFLVFVISSFGFAQEFKCGLNSKLAKLYAENPQLEKDHEALFKNGFSERKKENGEKEVIFTIPIVFHILHYDGSENITDDQVYNQMAILNRDYRLLNADTADVIPEFKGIYADIGIEFKLAAIDPYGNCTNGIEHIYTHETFNGDDNSKLHQWYRSHYLNVWVVDRMENGVAGYAYYPTAVDGSGFFRDGVIILNNYIGSIGTSNLNSSRALTHEIGHYLGLSHPWGSTNNPGVGCGDDGIADTPITKGSNLVCNLALSQCTQGVIENVQNYMDYSYCSRMFTLDQKSAMRNILQGISANRDQLITDSTHHLTGIDLTTPPLCTPIAYFMSNYKRVCKGQTIQFTDRSYNGVVSSREWSFADGNASSLTSTNPTVTFNTPGYKTIRLVVSNATGSDTVTWENGIYVAEDWADNTGPGSFDLNNVEQRYIFQVDNPEQNDGNFEYISQNGFGNSGCFRLDNFKDVSGANLYSNLYFYNDRLGGTLDALISPSFDLSHTTNVEVSFKYAYATNAINESDISEVLKVYSSRNCGQSWTLRKTLSGADLVSAGSFGYQRFAPENDNFWRTASFVYAASDLDVKTRFKFEFTASDFSNNLYLDDINVSGILGLPENNSFTTFEVYPNPSEGKDAFYVEFTANEASVFTMTNAFGQEISRVEAPVSGQKETIQLLPSTVLSAGCYFVTKTTQQGVQVKKVLVIK